MLDDAVKRYCCDCIYYNYDPNGFLDANTDRRHQCWHNNNLSPIDIVTGKFNFIQSPYDLRLRYSEDDEGACGKIGRWFKRKVTSDVYFRLPYLGLPCISGRI